MCPKNSEMAQIENTWGSTLLRLQISKTDEGIVFQNKKIQRSSKADSKTKEKKNLLANFIGDQG